MYTSTYFYEKHCLNFFHFTSGNWTTGLKSGTKKQTFVNKQMKSYIRAKSVSSVQLFSHVWLLVTPWTAACQASLSINNSQSLLKLMSTESVMPSDHPILCPSLLFLPSIFPNIWVFSNESILDIRWPDYWSFSFSISPSNEYSGLISFRMDLLDFLAVQRAFKSLLQNHSTKASILQHSAFFIVQLSYPYMNTGGKISMTRWTLLAK